MEERCVQTSRLCDTASLCPWQGFRLHWLLISGILGVVCLMVTLCLLPPRSAALLIPLSSAHTADLSSSRRGKEVLGLGFVDLGSLVLGFALVESLSCYNSRLSYHQTRAVKIVAGARRTTSLSLQMFMSVSQSVSGTRNTDCRSGWYPLQIETFKGMTPSGCLLTYIGCQRYPAPLKLVSKLLKLICEAHNVQQCQSCPLIV